MDGIASVHHLHIWELDEQHRALEAQVVLEEGKGPQHTASTRATLKRVLNQQFQIAHSTIELESAQDDCGQEDCTLCHLTRIENTLLPLDAVAHVELPGAAADSRQARRRVASTSSQAA